MTSQAQDRVGRRLVDEPTEPGVRHISDVLPVVLARLRIVEHNMDCPPSPVAAVAGLVPAAEAVAEMGP
jgi:hypothetical protein